MKLTLQEEELQRYKNNMQAHDASGMREAAEIAGSEATYHGTPVKLLYFPKAFTEEGYILVKDAGEMMWRILVKVIDEYLGNPAYRALFGFSKELEEWICRRPPYSVLLPVCRLDMFLNEETGDFRWCEFNADGSSAMNENRVMSQLYAKTLMWKELDAHYIQKPFELFDSFVSMFLGLWRESGRGEALPNVAIVDFLEKGVSAAEFERFREAFERAGCSAEVAEIRNMRFDGRHLYTESGMPVDAIYRRAVTSDILAHKEEIPDFLQAVRSGSTLLAGDFCTQVVHDKVLFRILHMEETKKILTPAENTFVAAHVPYTALLSEETARREDVLKRQKRWIIKPQDSYGAQGIFYSGAYTEDGWKDIVRSHAGGGYILQEYVEPYRTLNADYSDTDFTKEPAAGWQQGAQDPAYPHLHSFANMTGLYLYGGHLSGIYSRLSPGNIISVSGDEHEMASVVAYSK